MDVTQTTQSSNSVIFIKLGHFGCYSFAIHDFNSDVTYEIGTNGLNVMKYHILEF